jgi:hypothetical protein
VLIVVAALVLVGKEAKGVDFGRSDVGTRPARVH